MKLTVIVPLLVIALVQPQVINGQRPETVLIVRVERGWFSRQVDAYVTVTIGSTSHRTTTVRGNSDPSWNQRFTFINPTSSYMLVQVRNKAQRDARGGYKLMGECFSQVVAGAVNRLAKCNIRDGFVNIYYTC